jgi:hypothetical protein
MRPIWQAEKAGEYEALRAAAKARKEEKDRLAAEATLAVVAEEGKDP